MSIIHDALKKVQQNLNNQEPNTVNNTPINDQQSPKPSTHNPLISFVLLPLLLIVALIFLIKQLNTYFPQAFKNIPFISEAKKLALPTAKPTVTAPVTQPAATDTTTPLIPRLEGIMSLDNSYVALINGQVYQVNDAINGLTVTAINANEVTLEQNGQTTVLTLKN